MYMCMACGYPGLVDIPRSCGDEPSYEGCPACGFEEGYDNDDQCVSYAQWRDRWIARGCPWSSIGRQQPASWDPAVHLALRARLFPRTWQAGDVFAVPLGRHDSGIGQITRVEPNGYSIQVIGFDALVPVDRTTSLPSTVTPDRAFATMRTLDTYLVNRRWRILANLPVPPGAPRSPECVPPGAFESLLFTGARHEPFTDVVRSQYFLDLNRVTHFS